MSKGKIACAAALAALVAALPGCTGGRPPPQAATAAKAKKPGGRTEPAAEEEIEGGPDYGGPSVSRNLPLAGTAWEWQGGMNQDAFEVIDAPSRYRVEFKTNGWFDFQADCKHGTGMYEANGEHIALAVIKASRRGCRPGSKADEFLGALEAARTFRRAGGKLYIELKREPKTLVFGLPP